MRPVPVDGGTLQVHQLGEGPATVLALHGITANGLCFAPLADRLRGIAQLVAPDLRGRAGSAAVTSPAGLAAHVADAVAVLDDLGLEQVVLVGHSMGAYVAALAAATHPGRFSQVVLVDGGIAFPAPPGVDLDAVLTATIGPAMQRLSMRFGSAEQYLDFWRPHPALAAVFDGPYAAALAGYLRHDLVSGPDGGLRSSCDLEVIRADGADVLANPVVHTAAARSTVPSTLLWAERGMLDQTPGLLTAQAIAAAQLPDQVLVRPVADVNHYTILLSDNGLDAIATAIAAPEIR